MYYSPDHEKGEPSDPYHPNAVVMLIDQGFETMEGASGDDWISGAQSMRAYMRGALLAGIMASHLRRLGYSSRVHSNAYSEVLHIPAVLMAGLGELSRIGELVLNPFIGPRSKSIVFTTEMPLEADQPIDFGLQERSSSPAMAPDGPTWVIVSVTGNTGMTASCPRRTAAATSSTSETGTNARAASCTSTISRSGGVAASAALTDCCRWAPPVTTTSLDSATGANIVWTICSCPAGAATITAATGPACTSRRTACTSSGSPANDRSALGSPGPSRVPAPAAGTRTATSPP
jgi:hypothetical protein